MWQATLASLSFALQNLSSKAYGRRFPTTLPSLALINGLSLVVVCLLLGPVGARPMPGPAFALAAGFALAFLLSIGTILLALPRGPLGPTVLIGNLSMVIPVVAGLLFWGEALTWVKALGILLILCILVMSAMQSRGGGPGGWRWLLLTMGTFAGNGLQAILQHEMTATCPEVSALTFVFWAAVISLGVCILAFLFFWMRGFDLSPWRGKSGPLALCALGMGVGTAGGNSLTLLALTVLPAVVVFPLRQGLLVLIMWAVGVLAYKEKVTISGILTLTLGLAGIVLLNLP